MYFINNVPIIKLRRCLIRYFKMIKGLWNRQSCFFEYLLNNDSHFDSIFEKVSKCLFDFKGGG